MIYIALIAMLMSAILYNTIIAEADKSINSYRSNVWFDVGTGVLLVNQKEIKKFNSGSRNFKIMRYLNDNQDVWIEFSELEAQLNFDINKKVFYDMKLPSSVIETNQEKVKLNS